MPTPSNSALVLFSGGQDSTVCLAWALTEFEHVETIGFDYGQRHRVELDCRQTIRQELLSNFPAWQGKLGDDHVIDLGWMGQITPSALTRTTELALRDDGLPNTFVPGRNLIFLLTASTVAYQRQLGAIVTGVCQTDYSGYPDCRDDSIKALQVATNLGMASHFRFATPLMWRSKADTFRMADALGGDALQQLILEHSHSCYLGNRERRHPWGYGCGECPACQLRAAGWSEYNPPL